MNKKEEEKNESVFNLKEPIYYFQKSAFKAFFLIGISWILLVLCICIADNSIISSSDGKIMLAMLLLPGFFTIILGVKEKSNIRNYIKKCSYIKENGHKLNGNVKEILKSEYYRDIGGNSMRRIERKYLLIEFSDETIGIEDLYVTPRLYQMPKKTDIKCDVYMVLEELPKKYKKDFEGKSHPFKEYTSNNIVVDNFR